MKVYILMQYWGEEYHLNDVFANKDDAIAKRNEDLNGFDIVVEREVKGLP